MVSSRRSGIGNFNDPETSLAGMEQRTATDASLEMEDICPDITITTTSMLNYYSLTHEDLLASSLC